MFAGGLEKSKELGYYYQKVAEVQQCAFLDLQHIVVSDHVDGIHLAADQHQILGTKLAEKVVELLNKSAVKKIAKKIK